MSKPQTQTQSGNGHSKTATPSISPSPLTSQTSATQAVPALQMPFQREAYRIGCEVAEMSGRQAPDATERASVEAACRAAARQLDYGPYDPQTNPADRIADDEYTQAKEQRERLREQKDHAGRAVREAKRKKSQLPPAVKPEIPNLMIALLASLLAMTLAPTFHDRFFFGIDDLLLRWSVAWLTAGVVGLTLAFAGLRYLHLKAGKNEVGIVRGIFFGSFLIALALGLIRLTTGDLTWAAIYFAIALTVLEVGALAVMHHFAKPFRAAFEEYVDRSDQHAVAGADIAQAEEHYANVERAEAACQAAIDGQLVYVRARDYAHKHPDVVEEAYVTHGLLGYDATIGKNRLAGIVP